MTPPKESAKLAVLPGSFRTKTLSGHHDDDNGGRNPSIRAARRHSISVLLDLLDDLEKDPGTGCLTKEDWMLLYENVPRLEGLCRRMARIRKQQSSRDRTSP